MKRHLAFLVALLAASCGNDASGPPVTFPTAPTPARPQFAVSGTIRDGEGRPLEGVEIKGGVYISKTSSGGFTVRTDANGHYSGRLPEGSHSFSFDKAGFRTRGRTVIVTGDTTVDETMQPGVLISGMVSESGLPVSIDSTLGVLRGATIEIVDGVNKGARVTSGDRIGSRDNYHFDYLLPGVMRVRVTKEGFDPEERVITALDDGYVDFTLRWAYGNCLQSVAPVVFESYPVVGGTSSVSVVAAQGRNWAVSSAVPWLEVASAPNNVGPHRFEFRVLSNPIGGREARTGQLMVRCDGGGAQPVTVVQDVDCAITLSAAPGRPVAFPAEGGVGGLMMIVATPGCRWKASSAVEWMHTAGVSSWAGQPPNPLGQPDLTFVVRPNATGATRVGHILVGQSRWSVTQY